MAKPLFRTKPKPDPTPGKGMVLARQEATNPNATVVPPQYYRGAFVVTLLAIRDIERHFYRFASKGGSVPDSEVVVEAQVFKKNCAPETMTIADLEVERNPKGEPIWAIILSIKNVDCMAKVWIDSKGINERAAIRLFACHEDTASAMGLESAIRREAKNMHDNVLSHWVRFLVDTCLGWMHRNATKLIIGTIAVFVLCFIIALIVGTYESIDEQRRINALRSSIAQSTPHPTPEATAVTKAEQAQFDQAVFEARVARFKGQMVTIGFWGLRTMLLVELCAAYVHLFPRVSFELGEGKVRYERLTRLRFWIIGPLLVGQFAIPYLKPFGSELLGLPPSQSVPK
jgi:hypothetical protein